MAKTSIRPPFWAHCPSRLKLYAFHTPCGTETTYFFLSLSSNICRFRTQFTNVFNRLKVIRYIVICRSSHLIWQPYAYGLILKLLEIKPCGIGSRIRDPRVLKYMKLNFWLFIKRKNIFHILSVTIPSTVESFVTFVKWRSPNKRGVYKNFQITQINSPMKWHFPNKSRVWAK